MAAEREPKERAQKNDAEHAKKYMQRKLKPIHFDTFFDTIRYISTHVSKCTRLLVLCLGASTIHFDTFRYIRRHIR